jgi:hypothetical protein
MTKLNIKTALDNSILKNYVNKYSATTNNKYTPEQIVKAIKQVESSGGVNTIGKSGEKGALQYTDTTWKEYSDKYAKAKGLKAIERTPSTEEEVAKWKVASWQEQGMDVDQIASMWNHGTPNYKGVVGVNDYGVKYDTPAYVEKVLSTLEESNSLSNTLEDKQKSKDELTAKYNLPSGKATTGDIAKEFGKNLLGFGQAIARFPINIAKSLGAEKVLGEDIVPQAEEGSMLQKVTKTVFGEEPVGTIEEESEPISELINKAVLNKNASNVLGTGVFLALGALDYTTFGGASSVVKLLSKTDDVASIVKIGRSLNVEEDLLTTFAKDVAKMTDEKKITSYIKNIESIQGKTKFVNSQNVSSVKALPTKTFDRATGKIVNKTNNVPLEDEIRAELGNKALYNYKKGSSIATTKEVKLGAKEAEMGAKSGLPAKTKNISRSEMSLLKTRIRALKQGAKEGYVAGKTVGAEAGALKGYTKGFKEGSSEMKSAIKELQDNAVELVKKNLPVKLRGKHLNDIKNSTTLNGFSKAVNRIGGSIKSYKEAQVMSKTLGEKKSKMAFIRKMAEINQTAFNEIKKEAGITKGLVRATPEQLDKAIKLTMDRYNFKVQKGLLNVTKESKVKFGEYDKLLNEKKVGFVRKTLTKVREAFKKPTIDKTLGVLSTRIRNISPKINYAIRKVQFEIDMNNSKGKELVDNIYKKVKTLKKMDEGTYKVFNLAWNGGDYEVVKNIANKYGFEDELLKLRAYYDDIFKRAKEAGIEFEYRENYLPRKVNPKYKNELFDYFSNIKGGDGLTVFGRAQKAKVKELGRELTEAEKAQINSSILRGYGAKDLIISSGVTKSRQIEEFTADINKFYLNPLESAGQTIEEMNNLIGVKKFFKGEVKNLDDGTVDWSNTVGNYVEKLNLNASKSQELQEMLLARFSYKGSSDLVKNTKNLIYITHMNNFLNAITQTGDLAWSFYNNGFSDTIYGIVKSLSKSGIKREEIGITKNLAEMETQGILGNAVNTVFRASLIDQFDKVGKEAFINALSKNYQKQAIKFLKNGTEGKGIKFIKEVFEDKSDDVIKSFAKGERNENTMFTLANRLSDFQPTTLSEVPEMYLKHPNGRIFYALKTFTIKQLDIFRREVFQQIAKKETRAQGIKNLISLTTVVVGMNMGTDAVKDLIQGKEIDLQDSAVDNLLSIIGMNRYAFDTASREGVGEAMLNVVLPAGVGFINDVGKDIGKSVSGEITDPLKELNSIKYFPLIGKIFYQRAGKGSEYTSSSTSGSKIKTSKSKSKLKVNIRK